MLSIDNVLRIAKVLSCRCDFILTGEYIGIERAAIINRKLNEFNKIQSNYI